MLYLGVLIAAVLLLSAPAVQPWVEPVLAAGAAARRWLRRVGAPGPGAAALRPVGQRRGPAPAAAHLLERDGRAGGARVRPRRGAGRRPQRPRWQRVAAAAATAPLGLGLYLSFSRGALFACVAGLIALIVAGAQLGSAAGVGAGGPRRRWRRIPVAPFARRHRAGRPAGTREREGAIALVVLAAVMLAAGVAQRTWPRRGRPAVAPASSRAAHRRAPHLRRAGRGDRRGRQGDERAAGAVGRGDAPRLAAEQSLRLLGCRAAGLRRLAAARRRRRWLARRLAALAEGQRVRPGRSLARAADPGRARRGRGGPAARLPRRSRGGGPAGARAAAGRWPARSRRSWSTSSTARWIGIGRCPR